MWRVCVLLQVFLDHKTLYFDVEPFLFYIMTEVHTIHTYTYMCMYMYMCMYVYMYVYMYTHGNAQDMCICGNAQERARPQPGTHAANVCSHLSVVTWYGKYTRALTLELAC